MTGNCGFRYRGKYYGVGTIVKTQNLWEHFEIQEAEVISVFDDVAFRIMFKSGQTDWIFSSDTEEKIIEIVKPVRGHRPQPIYVKRNKKKNYPSEDDLFCGWLIYIFVMIFVSFMHGNIWLWILISFTFHLWKNGELGNKED